MSILTELNSLLNGLQIPVETGIFSGAAPDEYVVLTPLVETFVLHGDNAPGCDLQEVRLSLFSRGNYLARARQLVRALLEVGFTVTARQYIGHEDESGYHHYTIDTANTYDWEDN